MNATILSLFLIVLVVACVECQEGEECPGFLSGRCKKNEYCHKAFLPFLNSCVRYRERGMRCDRVHRCRSGLECIQQQDSFFGEKRCQDPSTTSTTTTSPLPTSTSTFMPDSTVTSTVSDSTMTV
ncbi:hypothetical protein AVEN_71285-1 [Araneus ventricosus]|uniref:EB domain-containing protein n=1 Tax=Araneus ventricosus TaxID=182803 RepID=A0A4Y2RUY0_ARAVE|nr:hypothetical protein AVEN_71285-1 [Araneus ventricosus]